MAFVALPCLNDVQAEKVSPKYYYREHTSVLAGLARLASALKALIIDQRFLLEAQKNMCYSIQFFSGSLVYSSLNQK